MKYINPTPYIEGNLTEIPAGLSYSEMKKRFGGDYGRVTFKDMNKTSQHACKMSQRMFAENLFDIFGNSPLAIEIYVAGQHKWTFEGTKEELRNFGYKKAMKLGAILNRRKPKDENGNVIGEAPKTNKDCTFRIRKRNA